MNDSCFIRGKVPMTKSEVRAVSLSKLEIRRDSIVYDIGAGTGSVSVEAAMLASEGVVYAVERKTQAITLMEQNRQHFSLDNMILVEGIAPDCLEGLPAPDCVFVGGTGGNLASILDAVRLKNREARIVLNLITLENQSQVFAYLEEHQLEAEIVQMNVSRAEKLGAYRFMQAQNPVTVVTIGPGTEEKT